MSARSWNPSCCSGIPSGSSCCPADRGADDGADLAAIGATLSADDPINIEFTSGTTGFPKGATLTHHNILNNGYFVGELCNYTEQDRICIPVPFYHCFGMVMGNLAATSHGACMVIPAPGFDPEGHPCRRRGRALHLVLRRADDVHRRTQRSRLRGVRRVAACAPESWRDRPARWRS